MRIIGTVDTDSARTAPRVTGIRIEYEDGTIQEAVGPTAVAIWEHWEGLETLGFVHGQRYAGPFLGTLVVGPQMAAYRAQHETPGGRTR